MRLEWLEDLLAVAETGSFQEAADRRRLTQSAFSRRIQHIEDQIGVELFDRSRKPVQPLPAMQQQRDQMVKLAQDLRQLVNDLRRGDRIAMNRIVIASQHALTTALTPQILKAIHARHADTHVRLRSANLDECFALLLSRQADLALVYRLPEVPHPIGDSYIETAVIGHDRLIPVYATSALDALHQQIARGDLPSIAYPPDVFLGQALDRCVLPQLRGAPRPVPKAETALTLAALEMASVGVGVAWVPGSLAAQRLADGSLTDLSTFLPHTRLEVTAVRLFGHANALAQSVWQHAITIDPRDLDAATTATG
jgi:DNA-binding transcriptional LysR family regulator